jgi:RNA polymerase sigma factor (TIGR02999 family)
VIWLPIMLLAADSHAQVTEHPDLTQRLRDWLLGQRPGGDQTMDALAVELSAIASRIMSRQPASHTLQATALLNEFWIKLSQSSANTFKDRQHFLGLAVTTMRCIVVDHAKAKRAQKRTPKGERVELELVVNALEDRGALDLVELNDALEVLGSEDPELLRLVELRFFGGLSIDEAAHVLGVNRAKLRADEQLARKRLARLMA